MKKIPTLFIRDSENMKLVLDQVTPGCEWVIVGEGKATSKLDGTCCRVRNGRLFKRHETRGSFPPDFELEETDPVTGKNFGWLPVDVNDPSNKWHMEAWRAQEGELGALMGDKTFELLGPKIQGNPERYSSHRLVPHGEMELLDAPRNFHDLFIWLSDKDIEGIVWWHPDGRKAKIKGRDFGIRRKR